MGIMSIDLGPENNNHATLFPNAPGNKRMIPPQPSLLGKRITNAQAESSDSVRAKLRESLADSLALLSKPPPAADSSNHRDGQPFQFNYVLLDEDVPFGKDELLQGNGLCWVSDLNQFDDTKSIKRPKFSHEDLPTQIEAQLFKLYGGVNKKYKEKGRSLLFNLKDRNNPELRERVFSGEIPPERLCSMTAEELASKELSQWRIAKAEELAQMVVLPDSSADVRRLVKKTHKGEFQVEYEQDDGASMEVAVGDISLPQFPQNTSGKEAPASSKQNNSVTSEASKHEKPGYQDKNLQSGFGTLPDDGADLMQGLMTDELKDTEFLPPIVSLDEFMESLDSEPPFENLPSDSEIANTKTDEKDNAEVAPNLEYENPGPSDSSLDKPENMKLKYTQLDFDLKSDGIDGPSENSHSASIQDLKPRHTHGESIKSTIPGTSTQEHVWEGLLQLNVSSMVTVSGKYKSGEKTSAKEWASFLDVKGRVRLDAFEKFLQELPKSRSRAVMIIHFCWKEGSPESGRVNLCEVVESYIADERVGFAEPAPGVELYLCPPHEKIIEMLGKHLSKDHVETLNAVNDGLIGIVVWRKVHVTSPNSSSHNKHNTRKQHRRHQERNGNTNPSGRGSRNPDPPLDDDDIPPGFGPAGRDDDDLPEFDFSRGGGGPNSHFTATNPPKALVRSERPVEQMRELIQKYGRGVDDDDDDDIPEWQPHSLNNPPPPPPPQPQHQHLAPPPPLAMPGPHLVQTFQPLGHPLQMMNQIQSFPPMQVFVHYPNQQQLEHMHPMPMPMQHMQPAVNVVMQGQQQYVNSPWQQQQGGGWPSAPPNFNGHLYVNPNNNSGAEWREDVNNNSGGF